MSHFAHHTHYEGYPSHENSLRVDTSVEPRREYRGVTRISNLIVENDQLKRKLQHQNSSLASVNAEIAKYDTVVEENTQLKLQNQFLREQIKNNSAMQNPLKANDKLLKEIESLREELGTVKGKKDRLDIMYDGAKKDINTLKDSIKKYEDIIERKDDKIVQLNKLITIEKQETLKHKLMCQNYVIQIKKLEKSHGSQETHESSQKNDEEEDVEEEVEEAEKEANEEINNKSTPITSPKKKDMDTDDEDHDNGSDKGEETDDEKEEKEEKKSSNKEDKTEDKTDDEF